MTPERGTLSSSPPEQTVHDCQVSTWRTRFLSCRAEVGPRCRCGGNGGNALSAKKIPFFSPSDPGVGWPGAKLVEVDVRSSNAQNEEAKFLFKVGGGATFGIPCVRLTDKGLRQRKMCVEEKQRRPQPWMNLCIHVAQEESTHAEEVVLRFAKRLQTASVAQPTEETPRGGSRVWS